MTLLEHSDHILRATHGDAVMVCEPVSAVDMVNGGGVSYRPGDKLRVNHTNCGLLWCLDEWARSVSFDRQGMAALDRVSVKGQQSQ
jgi:hypothetical protein